MVQFTYRCLWHESKWFCTKARNLDLPRCWPGIWESLPSLFAWGIFLATWRRGFALNCAISTVIDNRLKKKDKFVNTFTMFLQLFKEIFEITIQITLSIFTRAHLITCTLTIHWRSLEFTSVSLSVFANNFSYIFQVCWCLRLLIRKRQKYKISWADIPYRTKEIKENHME